MVYCKAGYMLQTLVVYIAEHWLPCYLIHTQCNHLAKTDQVGHLQTVIESCAWTWNTLEVELFQLLEQHHSRGSVLLLMYRTATHDLKNGNAHTGERHKQVWIQRTCKSYLVIFQKFTAPIAFGAKIVLQGDIHVSGDVDDGIRSSHIVTLSNNHTIIAHKQFLGGLNISGKYFFSSFIFIGWS